MLIQRCPHCMADLREYEEGPCPFCGFDQDAAPQPEGAMPRNTILHGKYLVGDVLGQGGFGITYIGFDLSLESKVAIKEYCPTGAATRRKGQNSLLWNRLKPPNHKPTMTMCRGRMDSVASPLQTATAKASMESPTASKNNSKIPILPPKWPDDGRLTDGI